MLFKPIYQYIGAGGRWGRKSIVVQPRGEANQKTRGERNQRLCNYIHPCINHNNNNNNNNNNNSKNKNNNDNDNNNKNSQNS